MTVKTLTRLYAFLLGIKEYRSDLTSSYEDYDLLLAYDTGRELAHRLTFRRFDR